MRAELIDNMGSDLTVVNSARVSFDRESNLERVCTSASNKEVTYEYVLSAKDTKLINYLARHNHWSPFAHPMISMRETVPIFVARQRFKHMVGFTYNEVSRRYVDDEPEFFMPKTWRKRPDASIKQGSSDETVDVLRVRITGQQSPSEAVDKLNQHALDLYKEMIEAGIAPEQARMVLPQSMYTSYYVTGSLAAWARAYKQRIDSHAQVEIQDLAKMWGDIIAPLYPVSWEALTKE